MDRELALAILMERIVRSAYSSRKSEEIQPLQWSILRYLSRSQDSGRDLASVASYVGVTSAPASRAVKTLEKRGLVEKAQSDEDRRSVTVKISAEGLRALKHDPLSRIALKLKSLSQPEFAAMSIGLRNLVLLEEDSADDNGKSADR